ncbi:hypothetical protein D3C80_1103080 [compost metagenome]
MLAVGFVEDVIQAGAEFDLRSDLVGHIGGKHAKARTVGKVFTHHVTLIDRHTVLATDQTPKAGAAPVATFVG